MSLPRTHLWWSSRVWESGTQSRALDCLTSGATLGQQYGTLCSALSVAERRRDAGGHTLVVLDDVSCMVRTSQRTKEKNACSPVQILELYLRVGLSSHATRSAAALAAALLRLEETLPGSCRSTERLFGHLSSYVSQRSPCQESIWHVVSDLFCCDHTLQRHTPFCCVCSCATKRAHESSTAAAHTPAHAHVSGPVPQTAMWDRVTAALAQLGPAALALQPGQAGPDPESATEEELVEYEGMLISASAAQRRRCRVSVP